MRLGTLLVGMAVLLSACTPDQPRYRRPPSKEGQELVLAALGDSLTAGVGVPEGAAYPALLQAKLATAGIPARVVNYGASGDTAADGLARVDAVLEDAPELVIVALGANDYLRGLDAVAAERDLRAAIQRLRDGGAFVVLAGFEFPKSFVLSGRVNPAVEDIYPRIAEETGVAFIPSFLRGVAGKHALNQDDQIHPTAEGYRVIVDENVWPVLEQVLADMLEPG